MTFFEGKSIINKEDLYKLDNSLVIICMYNKVEGKKIKKEIENTSCKCVFYDEILPKPWDVFLEYDELRNSCKNGIYEDCFNNKITFYGDVPRNIKVRFCGVSNSIIIGKNVSSAQNLILECGTKGEIIIGDDSTFHRANISSSWGKIEIGRDCMISFGVYIRNNDSHHIYDIVSGERINYIKPICIGDHVWVGQNAILLPGFEIGKDSIVGAGAVSSSKFPNNVIIAGNSARIIRENVTWGRENTYLFDNNYMYD